MATTKQLLGAKGEQIVAARCACPKCKRSGTLKRLPNNFKCADVICDFCGYLAQVKAVTCSDLDVCPPRVLGAAWSVQRERMEAGIYFPLFIVLVSNKRHSVYYLSADLQQPSMFVPRTPLSAGARRAGWQGYVYDLSAAGDRLVRLL